MTENRFFRQNCYINGEWTGGGKTIEVNNPATGEIIGSVPRFGRKETAAAIDAAQAAFFLWKARPAAERAELCR
ncbi:MAG: aldehyde dehydrogenase family protein, partial [Amphiplicatus sp.]